MWSLFFLTGKGRTRRSLGRRWGRSVRRETHPARVGHVCRAGKSCPRQETYAEAVSQGERHPTRGGMVGAHIDSGMAVPTGWRRKKVGPCARVIGVRRQKGRAWVGRCLGREKERLPEWEDVGGAAVRGQIGGEGPPNEMRPSPKTQGTFPKHTGDHPQR